MKAGALILLVFAITIVSAACDKGQIDINTADLNELDNLTGVGPAIAQNIIDARPYKTVDDLVNAKGIAEAKLSKIKEQGLACVEEAENKSLEEEEPLKKERVKKPNTYKNESSDPAILAGKIVNEPKESIPLKVIKLSSKDIKSEDVKEGSKAIYWLGGFVVLLGLLFLLRGRRQKTEFDD